MTDPTPEEVKESIDLLTRYKERLTNEIKAVSQRIRMPEQRIKSSLEQHPELKNIEDILAKLTLQRDTFDKSS